MEIEIERTELAAAFVLVITVTPRLLVLEMIESRVHMIGRTTMR
jgi:hypothetical protein